MIKYIYNFLKILVVVITLSFSLPQAIYAVSYYVATNGNDSNPGTINSPWRTIQKAANTLQAADSVYVRQGTYYERITPVRSGSNNNYITYSAYQGEQAVIDGSNLGQDDTPIININNKSYIQIIGFRIQNAQGIGTYRIGQAGIGVQNRSSNIIIKNNHTYNTKSSGIYINGSSYITLDGNEIERAVNGGSQECISLESVNYFEIKNNVVHNGVGLEMGGEGIDIKVNSSYGSIHDNLVYDLPDEVGYYIDAYNSTLKNIELYNNYASTVNGIEVAAEQGGTVENIRIYNNVVYATGNFSKGIKISNCCGVNVKRNINIYNNTVYNYSEGIIIHTPLSGATLTDIEIINNIASNNKSAQIIDGSNQAIVRNNLINGYKNASYEIKPDGVINFSGDPLFINTNAYNFQIQNNSPAIDKGINIYVNPNIQTGSLTTVPLAFDIAYRVRPQRATNDIGAYEFLDSGTLTPVPTITIVPTVVPTVTPMPTNTPSTMPTPTRTPTPIPTSMSAKNYQVFKLGYQPIIDGDLDEFTNAEAIILVNNTGGHGEYRLLYDQQALYVGARVADATLNAVGGNDGNLWLDDSVEIMLDVQNNKGSEQDANDYKFFINILNKYRDEWAGDAAWNANPGVQSAVVLFGTIGNNNDVDTGYKIELRIPWSAIGATVAEGRRMGFDIVMNNRISNSNVDQIVWSNSDGGSLNIPDGWGSLLFTDRVIPAGWQYILSRWFSKTDLTATDNNQDGLVNSLDWAALISN